MTASCRDCTWTGCGDTAANRHTRDTGHATVTSWAGINYGKDDGDESVTGDS